MQSEIKKAIQILKQGGLVALPTETVYGLGADAAQPEAIKKIFAAKNRPTDHPLIVHIGDITQLNTWARDISADAKALAEAFWPGPLTLILKKASHVSDLITGGQDTIGIRIPRHPLAQTLLLSFGSALVAPSANRFGHISPTTAEAVREELNDSVDMILDGGQCEVGVESTIVDVSGSEINILRPGIISAAQIEKVLKKPLSYRSKMSPRVSGSLESHYAPTTPTYLIETNEISTWINQIQTDEFPLAILLHKTKLLPRENIYMVSMPLDSVHYAHDLYAVLRNLDKGQFKKILIENVPNSAEWDAIRDRVFKATR